MSIHSQYITGRKFVELTHSIVYKDQNIYSLNNLCASVAIEEFTVTLTSEYTLSVLVEELVASLGTIGISLCVLVSSAPTLTLASVYSLSTAVT